MTKNNHFSQKPAITFFRNKLLPYSETFIQEQAEALQNFIPYYTGMRLVSGLPLSEERTLLVNRGGFLGKMSEGISKLRGEFPPLFTRKLKEINPSLIHAHFAQDGTLALPLAETLKIPLLVTFYGFDVTVEDSQASFSLVQRLYLQRREMLKQKARLFIAISEFIKKNALDQGFPSDRMVVNSLGIDTELFKPNPSVQREPIVLFVARLVEKKGCEYLIQAMSKVQMSIPEVELVIIGDGNLRSSLERQAEKMLHRYRFLGVQSSEKVKAWMQRAQVFCVPSITASSGDAEGLGVVFLEAQATGLPVVSSFSGGIPEVVAHSETGFLAAERDWEELAKYILLLLNDSHLWSCFSEAGLNRVRNLFNLQKQSQTLEEIYKQVLSNKESDS